MQRGVGLTALVGGVGEGGSRCSVTRNGHSDRDPGSFSSFPLPRATVRNTPPFVGILRSLSLMSSRVDGSAMYDVVYAAHQHLP